VDLGLDPMQRIAHQAHALFGVEALDGLHQADIAFLDQVALRQAVAEVLARDGNHQAQVRQHQATGAGEVAAVAQLARSLGFLGLRQQRNAVHGRNVGVEVADRRHHRPRVANGQRGRRRQGQGSSSSHGVLEHYEELRFQNISTLPQRVLMTLFFARFSRTSVNSEASG
jgi:hypothetical protein